MYPKNQQIKTQQEEIRQWEEVAGATPDKLREDAEWFRIQTRHCGNPNCGRCDRFTRAALILDTHAVRMESPTTALAQQERKHEED
jgi:hypothetical protein